MKPFTCPCFPDAGTFLDKLKEDLEGKAGGDSSALTFQFGNRQQREAKQEVPRTRTEKTKQANSGASREEAGTGASYP